MRPLLSAAQMRLCDQYTIDRGTPSRTLMERAARAAIAVMKQELPLTFKSRVLVLCGSGNNGGDGFAMARFLFDDGYNTTVCYGGQWSGHAPDQARMSVECARQYELWQACGGATLCELPPLTEQTVIVDALFGIGLDRPIMGKTAAWIDAVNQSKSAVLAVDIPSGVCADTGKILGVAMHATVTATIACPKLGLLLFPGASCVGKFEVCDIGIETAVLHGEHPSDAPAVYQITPEDLTLMPKRPAYANKGTFGRVLVIGGFEGMCGAVYFAAKSAYRAGAGLVEIVSIESNRTTLQTLIPEAVFTNHVPAQASLSALLDRADCVVLGCGLGQSAEARLLCERILSLCQRPLVLDADALNLLAAHKSLQALLTARKHPTILTPHLGEASRLIGLDIPRIAADLIAAADIVARQYHAVCVLKDARTVITDGSTHYMQDRGNSGMATGGSGDCLAGLVGSLLAQHRNCNELSPCLLASLGVLLHAMAGDIAAARIGEHAVMASDIADAIGEALRISPAPPLNLADMQ